MAKPKTVTITHPKLGVSRTVPNRRGLLRTLARSGWRAAGDPAPKTEPAPTPKKP